MSDFSRRVAGLPPRQPLLRGDRVRPTNPFIEFKKEEIEQSIPERFEQMVRLYPDPLAVKTWNHSFTYEELNKTANRIARAILAQRGEGEEPIALVFEQGAQVIAGILGVLKAGKFYVPLDPSLPQERIVSVLEDSLANLIVTNNKNLPLTKELSNTSLQIINIDNLDTSLSSKNLGLSISPDALALLFYTSGSTGKPKAVMDKHRNLLHDCMIYTNNFHICSDDRLTHFRSCSFAGSIHYLYGALLNGASLHPLNIKEQGLNRLANWLIEEEITLYSSVATTFRHFVRTLSGNEKFSKLRLIKLGSEFVSKADVELYKKHFAPDCIIVNGLSTTEAETATQYYIDKRTRINTDIVPVGYSVEDKELMLLDDDGKEVEMNQVGEISVKSRYISPGYWRNPDLTEAKFLPDPNGGDKRVYLTGDLGRMMPDGCLEYIGRKDLQVKIRGYRIETGEIEIRLLDHAAIKEVAVATRKDQSGDNRLVAYFVPTRQPGPSVNDLREFLKEKFPDYMIPSAFLMLDTLPLLPNGKVDRKALPVPDSSRPDLESPFVAPRTPTEKELAKIWAEVLGLDQVGIDDTFFDLGGHSLAATRVVSRVIDRFKVELPIKSLFESGTVADMAEIIAQNQGKKVGLKNLDGILNELETLSDEEAQRLLADENT